LGSKTASTQVSLELAAKPYSSPESLQQAADGRHHQLVYFAAGGLDVVAIPFAITIKKAHLAHPDARRQFGRLAVPV